MNIQTIDKIIGKFADKIPEKIAIEFGQEERTYKQLDENSNKIANFLIDNFNDIKNVLVLMEKSPELIEALIGVIKSGGIFVPLDYEAPNNRIISIMNEIKVNWIITTPNMLTKLKSIIDNIDDKINILLINSEDLTENIESFNLDIFLIKDYEKNEKKVYEYCNNKHCYIYFTSGSTGKSKAVLGRHRSLMQFIEWEIGEFDINEEYKVSQLTPITFDPFLRDVFIPLCAGATLCIPNNKEVILNPNKLINWIQEKHITLIHMVPSLFKTMVNYIEDKEKLKSLKYIILAGELLRGNDIKKAIEIFGSEIQLVNLYGPTETTLAKIFYKIKEEDVNRGIIPVGRPIDFTEILILNDDMQKCLVGVVGEVFIRTPFITSGYCNNRELTRKVFIKNPFNDNNNDILYKTGDLGRKLDDGNIELIGRADNQVKIRGMRIELGEIETRLIQSGLVTDAAVIVKEDKSKEKYICAYVVTDKQISVKELKIYLGNSLPKYMLPSYYIQLEKMPLTPNGKIDRKALINLDGIALDVMECEEPRNRLEKELVDIWKEVLGVERIGINDNFFDLGGNSLKAIKIAEKIYKELNVNLPVTQILNKETIKDISSSKLDYDVIEYFETITRLNDEMENKIFAFPPFIGYGIAYKELAKILNSHSIYAFNFIESENLMEEYVKLILEVQKEGPYILMGYSAGGKLAFEIAKELENKGHEVSDLILIDSGVKERTDNKLDYKVGDASNDIVGNIEEQMLNKAPLIWEYIKESVERKVNMYEVYLNKLHNTGTVNANIHQVLASENIDEEKTKLKYKWKKMTYKNFKHYQGVGIHVNMLEKENIERNAEIIREILVNIE